MGDITLLIARAREGDREALDDLFKALYPELRQIAHQRLRRGFPDPDLGTTALVHECYLKLHAAQRMNASDRAHGHKESLADDCLRRMGPARESGAKRLAGLS
jgi:hypothetical protein